MELSVSSTLPLLHVREETDERGEGGFSLIETLIAEVIIGMAVIAMLAALTTLLSTTGLHRRQADVGAVLESASENLKAQAYVPCAGTGTYGLTSVSLPDVTPPAVAGVTYWNSANGGGFQASCPSPDQGLEMVQIQASSKDGSVTQSLTVMKANR